MYTRRADLLNSLPYRYASAIPTTQPSPIRIDVSLYALLYTLSLHMGGRAFGPPLCRGCAPATPPYKNMPHRPCVRFPSIVSGERSLLPHLPSHPTDHRPPTANHRCSTENKKLKTKNCSPGRPSIDYAIRYPEWQPARQAGQDRLPILLSRCAQYKKSPPSGELCNRLIPAEEIRPTHKCPDGCLVIAGDASSIRYCRN